MPNMPEKPPVTNILSDQAVELGLTACGTSMPELRATEALQKSTSQYWGLIGDMTMKAAVFADRFQNAVAESGGNELYQTLLPTSFDVPPKSFRYGIRYFDAYSTWKIGSYHPGPYEYKNDSWQFASKEPFSDATFGEIDAVDLVVTRQGNIGLNCDTRKMISPAYYRRMTDKSRHKKYGWDRLVIKQLDAHANGELAKFIVSPEEADSPKKAKTVLNRWEELLNISYESNMEQFAREMARRPHVL